MVRTSEFILNFVVNASWQIAAICALAGLLSLLLGKGPARYRHALWVVALTACLVVPLLTAARFVPEVISSLQVVASSAEFSNSATASSTRSVSETDANVDHIGSVRRKTIETTSRTVLFLALAYALFVFARGVRLVRFWRRKERLRRSASEFGLPATLAAAAEHCRELLKL